jgi:uncharacterized phage protein (TIGR02218 family)
MEDGVKLAFTDHDQDIELEGTNYCANGLLHYSAVESFLGLNSDNLAVKIAMDDHLKAAQSAKDLSTAKAEIHLVDYICDDKFHIFSGRPGQLSWGEDYLAIELKSLRELLGNHIGEIYSATCRADFCDDKCKLASKKFTKELIVTNVPDEMSLDSSDLIEEDGYYNYGQATFLSGNNLNQKFDIRVHCNRRLTFHMMPSYVINIGDRFAVIAGCDKRFATCYNKFSNAINFRGEPNIPGYEGLV